MTKIKEKPIVHDPKVLGKALHVSREAVRRGVGEGVERVRQQVQDAQGHSDTPENYGADKIDGAARDGVSRVGRAAEDIGGRLVRRIKTRVRYQAWEDSHTRRPDEPSPWPGENTLQYSPGNCSEATASPQQEANVQDVQECGQQIRNSVRPRRVTHPQAPRGTKQQAITAKATSKAPTNGLVKTARRGVKTVGKTVKATSKSIKTAERTARVAAKTTVHTTKATVRSIQAAVQATRITVKAIISAVKAIIATAKSLVAAIAAGGWVAIVIILAVGIVAVLLSSPFGIFANGGDDKTASVSEAVQTLNDEFEAKIAGIKQDAGPVDQVKLPFIGDDEKSSLDNWPDILAVFAVSASLDTENPMDVVVMDDQRIALLRQVFWKMVSIEHSVTAISLEPTPQGAATPDATVIPTSIPTQRRVLNITISTRYWEDAASVFDLTEQQKQMLEVLMSSPNYSLLESLAGSVSGVPATDWSGVIDIPEGGMQIPLYLQGDYPQVVCYINGAPKSVKSSGCGAASMSMVISYLTGNTSQNPYTLFQWAYDNGCYDGDGFSHSCLTKMAELYGVKGAWISNNEAQIADALRAGYPVIAHMGPGIFTTGGHYIVLRGITEDGHVLVNDPGNRSRNKYAYLLSTVVKQARTSNSFMVCMAG